MSQTSEQTPTNVADIEEALRDEIRDEALRGGGWEPRPRPDLRE